MLVALDNLFGAHVSDNAYGTLCGSAFATVGLLFFLAYVTRREPFEYPKVWRVLLVFAALSLVRSRWATPVAYGFFAGGYLQTRQKEGEKDPQIHSAYGQCLILRK